MVALAAWCAASLFPHHAHAIARAPINNVRSVSVTRPACPTCSGYARTSSVAARWWRRPCTNARVAVNVSSASGVARSAISLAGHRVGRPLPRMRYATPAGRSPRRGGGCASLSYPQRRANGRGHAALLAQSLDNRCAVTHMPTLRSCAWPRPVDRLRSSDRTCSAWLTCPSRQ